MEKFCSNCGKELNEGQDVCLKCGALVKSNSNKDKFAITGFILGLVSIVMWLLPFLGYPVTICGIIFSAKGLKSNNRAKALTGLILSIVFLVFTLGNSCAGLLMWAQDFNYYY